MSVAAPAHPVRWSAPAPLWDTLAADPAQMATPVLLTLAGDSFMVDLRKRLARDPAAIAALRATARSHRVRPPGRPDGWEPAGAPTPPLKLYGAVHGRYNLVGASLVCGVGGLPERRLRTTQGDRLVFVVRRLDAAGAEQAWVPGVPSGAWRPAPSGELLAGEEQLPMFSLEYAGEEGVPRRLHVGLVPTASVESWTPPPPPPTPQDAALARARRRLEIAQLVETYATLADDRVWAGPVDHVANATDAVDLWLIDLADFLMRWHPSIWSRSAPGAPIVGAPTALLQILRASTFADGKSLAAHAHAAWVRREGLLGEAGAPRQTLALRLNTLRLNGARLDAKTLSGVLALAPASADAAPPAAAGGTVDPRSPRQAKLDPSGRTEHVIRCAYLRPQCASVHGPVVSGPTERFRLASFFDPDAPARDVHIALPIATGVKDLRKMRKTVSIAISEQLQAQMGRVGELKDAMDGKRKDGGEIGFGMVCSFSIPIITLCALIVLMIFITLLNIIFFWLPLLKICLPVPKGSGS